LQLAGFRIKGLQESRSIEIVGGTDQQVVADHNRGDGGEVLLVEIRNDFSLSRLRYRTK
jgi:hypothetical protein